MRRKDAGMELMWELGVSWRESPITRHTEKEFAELCSYFHSAKWQIQIWLAEGFTSLLTEEFKELQGNCGGCFLLWTEQNRAAACTHETRQPKQHLCDDSSVHIWLWMHAPSNPSFLTPLFLLFCLLKARRSSLSLKGKLGIGRMGGHQLSLLSNVSYLASVHELWALQRYIQNILTKWTVNQWIMPLCRSS